MTNSEKYPPSPGGVAGGNITMSALSGDLLLIGAKIKSAPDIGSPVSLLKLVLSYLDTFETACLKAGKSRSDIENARYAIGALIDEMVLNRRGDDGEFWAENLIIVKLFNDSTAGEGFFYRLESITGSSAPTTELLEVYLLCLCLGFKGRYRLHQEDKLSIIVSNILTRIESVRGRPPRALSPSANVHPGLNVSASRSKFYMTIAAIFIISGILLYLLMGALSNNCLPQAQTAIEQLKVEHFPELFKP